MRTASTAKPGNCGSLAVGMDRESESQLIDMER